MEIDWDTLKIRYEMFGDSIETLALASDVPPDLLLPEIEKRNWKRSALALTPVGDDAPPDCLESFAATFTEAARQKLTVLSLARQLAFADQYATLERKLLKAALLSADNLEPGDTKELRQLTSILKELTDNSITTQLNKVLQEDKDDGKGGIIVQILNEIKHDKAEAQVTAIEVQ